MIVCKHFEGTPVILFLNKKDLFEEKIKRVPLDTLFPDYEGGEDFDKASSYIEEKFKSMRTATMDTGSWHCQLTCALDTDRMGDLLRAVGKLFAMRSLDDLFSIE